MHWLGRTRFTSVFFIAMTIASVSPTPAAPARFGEPTRPEAQAAVLAVEGEVSMNGVAAEDGATVASGSTISTKASGTARIDVPTVGRVELGPETIATVSMREGEVIVTLGSTGSVRPTIRPGARARVVAGASFAVEVTRGMVRVAEGGLDTAVPAGHSVTRANAGEVFASGNTLFLVRIAG